MVTVIDGCKKFILGTFDSENIQIYLEEKFGERFKVLIKTIFSNSVLVSIDGVQFFIYGDATFINISCDICDCEAPQIKEAAITLQNWDEMIVNERRFKTEFQTDGTYNFLLENGYTNENAFEFFLRQKKAINIKTTKF